jgi:hypothetical protein
MPLTTKGLSAAAPLRITCPVAVIPPVTLIPFDIVAPFITVNALHLTLPVLPK